MVKFGKLVWDSIFELSFKHLWLENSNKVLFQVIEYTFNYKVYIYQILIV
jgi:hypothetical protein